MGRVLGLGSTRSGTEHWWMQRVTSVASVPLTLWFLIEFLRLPNLGFAAVRAWLTAPLSGFLMALTVIVLSYHSYLGVCVVAEDYVHGHGVKVVSLMALRFAHVLAGGAALFAVLRIVFGAVS
jgi:succinate dehydrogenase / fumarate reductase, membrane anchor subunit